MDIQPENADNLQTVTACRANGITLDQTDYHGA